MLADAQIADTALAQALIHVGQQVVEQRLGERLRLRPLLTQMAQNQKGMQYDHVKTAVERIRDAQAAVKGRVSRLGHNAQVHVRGQASPPAPREQSCEHGVASPT